MRARQSQAQAVMGQPELGLGMPAACRAMTPKPGHRPSQGKSAPVFVRTFFLCKG